MSESKLSEVLGSAAWTNVKTTVFLIPVLQNGSDHLQSYLGVCKLHVTTQTLITPYMVNSVLP